jgi:alkylation response protein AidB-like acyl-CoA dehydrogenase
MNDTIRVDSVARAAAIADEVLFPAALRVDVAEAVPAAHLDLLAAEGLYGVAGPPEYGGLGLEFDQACRVIEQLASGCLATAFVWLQHHATVLSLTYGEHAPQREQWLARLCSGAVRSGIALNGVRPGASPVYAKATGTGCVLDGETDWVTGWGMLDLLQVAAFDERGDILYCLVEVANAAGLHATPLDLIAGRASGTVRLRFAGQPVPADQILGSYPAGPAGGVDTQALRVNASLALGVASRCTRMTGAAPLADELSRCRSELDRATDDTISTACAAATELAMRAATAVFTATGSRSVLPTAHAGRLAREALLLLVFASRPAVRQALLDRLTRAR